MTQHDRIARVRARTDSYTHHPEEYGVLLSSERLIGAYTLDYIDWLGFNTLDAIGLT